jgi:hypothetical protein
MRQYKRRRYNAFALMPMAVNQEALEEWFFLDTNMLQ